MTVTDATNVNTLLEWLFGLRGVDGKRVSEVDAGQAALELAEKANKTLMAGITPKQVSAYWPPRGRRRQK